MTCSIILNVDCISVQKIQRMRKPTDPLQAANPI
jgi:hypothetical protein